MDGSLRLEYSQEPSSEEGARFIVYLAEDQELYVTIEEGCPKTLKEILQERLEVSSLELVERTKRAKDNF